MDKCVKRLGMGITSGKAAKAVENQRARKLYEEIFDEDSPAFVYYYFRVKAAEMRFLWWKTRNRRFWQLCI